MAQRREGPAASLEAVGPSSSGKSQALAAQRQSSPHLQSVQVQVAEQRRVSSRSIMVGTPGWLRSPDYAAACPAT
jgi:hypothetical protein